MKNSTLYSGKMELEIGSGIGYVFRIMEGGEDRRKEVYMAKTVGIGVQDFAKIITN